jgi:predicted nucleic acid-binding protein
MTVTDASIWVSLFLVDDAFHAECRLWLKGKASQGEPLIAPVIVLAEVAGAVARRTGSSQFGYQAVKRIQQIPTLQLVAISAEMGEFAAEVASTYRLRGADAIYVAVAYQMQMPLVSWDQEQIVRTTGFINAFSPET